MMMLAVSKIIREEAPAGCRWPRFSMYDACTWSHNLQAVFERISVAHWRPVPCGSMMLAKTASAGVDTALWLIDTRGDHVKMRCNQSHCKGLRRPHMHMLKAC